jgi:hypothetical protein
MAAREMNELKITRLYNVKRSVGVVATYCGRTISTLVGNVAMQPNQIARNLKYSFAERIGVDSFNVICRAPKIGCATNPAVVAAIRILESHGWTRSVDASGQPRWTKRTAVAGHEISAVIDGAGKIIVNDPGTPDGRGGYTHNQATRFCVAGILRELGLN